MAIIKRSKSIVFEDLVKLQKDFFQYLGNDGSRAWLQLNWIATSGILKYKARILRLSVYSANSTKTVGAIINKNKTWAGATKAILNFSKDLTRQLKDNDAAKVHVFNIDLINEMNEYTRSSIKKDRGFELDDGPGEVPVAGGIRSNKEKRLKSAVRDGYSRKGIFYSGNPDVINTNRNSLLFPLPAVNKERNPINAPPFIKLKPQLLKTQTFNIAHPSKTPAMSVTGNSNDNTTSLNPRSKNIRNISKVSNKKRNVGFDSRLGKVLNSQTKLYVALTGMGDAPPGAYYWKPVVDAGIQYCSTSISVPPSLVLNSSISLRMEILDENNKVISHSSRRVNFKRISQKFSFPTIAPTIGAEYVTTWENHKISLAQNDPHATKIKLYRQVRSFDPNSTQPGFIHVADFSVAPGKTYQHVFVGQRWGQAVYRAFAATPDNVSQEFDTCMLDPTATKNPNINALLGSSVQSSFDAKFKPLGSLFISVQTMGMRVKVDVEGTLSTTIATLQLMATDVTYSSKRCSINNIFRDPRARIVGTPRQQVPRLNIGPFSIEDVDVVMGHYYRYELIGYDTYGNSHKLSAVYTHHYWPGSIENENIDLIVQTPRIRNSQGAPACVIPFSLQFKRSGLESILAQLRNASMASAYQLDVDKSRQRLNPLLRVGVTRYNKKTNKCEFLGYESSITAAFEDSPSRAHKWGYSPLEASTGYHYVFRVYIAELNSFFKNAFEEVTDENTLTTFQQKGLKFLCPRVLNTGILESTATFNSVREADLNRPDQVFELGDTFIEESTAITIPGRTSKATINAVLAAAKKGSGVIVSWQITGDPATVDSYIISADYNGVIAPIGIIHSFNQVKNIYYDNTISDSVGPRKYVVQPVYLDYNLGPSVESDILVIANNNGAYGV
jgi:hypothetical protein